MLLINNNNQIKHNCSVNNPTPPTVSKGTIKRNFNSIYNNGELSRNIAANYKGQIISFNRNLSIQALQEAFDHLESNVSRLKTLPVEMSLSTDKKRILIPENVELEHNLNVIAQSFPGLLGCIENPDNRSGSVAGHLLKTFKILLEDEDYQALSDKEDKLVVKVATLCHDIAKNEINGLNDNDHPTNSAKEVYEACQIGRAHV